MRKNIITKTLAIAMGLSFVASSFSTIAAVVPDGVKLAAKQELVRGNGSEVSSLDPHQSDGTPEANVMLDLFEGLVTQDGQGNIVPGVAQTWENVDNKIFTFHLRKDAKWSNGEPVTAQDFVYSLQRVVDPATASPYAWYVELMAMVNAKDIIHGKKDKSTLGVKALDPHTLQISLTSSLPYFVMMMCSPAVSPVPQATVEKYGTQWTKPEHFVGNGAFILNKWVVNERIVLTPNHYYWDNAHTVLNKVTFLPIESQVSEMNRFLSGEIDFTDGVPDESYRHLKKEHPDELRTTGSLSTYYYSFNTKTPPFNDVRVRKAMSYAIDRDIITNIILGQGQKPAYSLTPDIVAGFTLKLPEYAKMTQKERNAKAVELLSEAGFDKSHPLKFSLLYNTNQSHKKLAIAIASMWKKTLGVTVSLENQEWKSYLETKKQGNFQVARAGWGGAYNEPSAFTNLMEGSNSAAGIHYQSEDYDKLVKQAITAKSAQERTKIYDKEEALLSKDMPIAPIYQNVSVRLVNPHVGGYTEDNAQNKIYSKDIYIIEK